MQPKPSVRLIIIIILLTILACDLPNLFSPAPQTESDLQTAVANSLADTAVFQTSVAQAVIETQQVTWEARQTVIIEQTVTPAAGNPLVSVSQATNCRSGPGTTYDWLGSLGPGLQVEVFARDPYNTSWFIRNPNNPSDFCWIYGGYATLSGDASTLPVYTPMPTPTLAFTPTPVSDFLLSILLRTSCGFDTYQLRFQVTNTGSLTWQSFRIKATDTTTNMKNEIVSDTFREKENCSSVPLLSDLAPGESGYLISESFVATTITGHIMIAEITLCSQDNLQGNCLTRVVEFSVQ